MKLKSSLVLKVYKTKTITGVLYFERPRDMDLVGFGTRHVSCEMSKVRAWTLLVNFISTVHLLQSQCSRIDIITITLCNRNTYSLYRVFCPWSYAEKGEKGLPPTK